MNLRYKCLALVLIFATASTSGANQWMLDIIERGPPHKLVALLLLLKYQLDDSSPADAETLRPIQSLAQAKLTHYMTKEPWMFASRQSQSRGTGEGYRPRLPTDVIKHVIKWIPWALQQPTLNDAARLRRTFCSQNRGWLMAVDNAVKGRAEYVVNSPESLACLMLLDGNPLLRAVGKLSFHFGDALVLPSYFPLNGVISPDDMASCCMEVLRGSGWTQGVPKKWHRDALFAAILIEHWPQFLSFNRDNLKQLHSLNVLGGSDAFGGENPYDYFFIEPLLRNVPGLNDLRRLKLSRADNSGLFRMLQVPSFGQRLEELELDGFCAGPDSALGIRHRIAAGHFRSIRCLTLRSWQWSESEWEAFIHMAPDLTSVTDLWIEAETALGARSLVLARLLMVFAESLVNLQKLKLGGQNTLFDVLAAARTNGAFQNLHVIDASHARPFRPLVHPFVLHELLPSLQYLILSMRTQYWLLPILLTAPQNIALIEVVDDMTDEQRGRTSKNLFRNLRPALALNRHHFHYARPSLLRFLERLAEDRMVIESERE